MQKDVLKSKLGRIHLLTRCYMQLLYYVKHGIFGEFLDSLILTIGDLSYDDFWCDVSFETVEHELQAVIKETDIELSFLADEFISITIKSGDLDQSLGELWFDSAVVLCEFTSRRSKFLKHIVDVFLENRQAFVNNEYRHLIGMLIEAQMMETVEFFAKALGVECFTPSSQDIEQDLLRVSLELSQAYSESKSKKSGKVENLLN